MISEPADLPRWGQLGIELIAFGAAALAGLKRLDRIEAMLGNGKPGVFVRKGEAELVNEEARKDRDRLQGEIDELERRLEDRVAP